MFASCWPTGVRTYIREREEAVHVHLKLYIVRFCSEFITRQ